jgi:hypothetical protein
MKIKLEIRTPIGQAKKSAARLRPFIIGLHKVNIDQYVSQDDGTIYWEIDGSIRDILKIQRNATMFGTMMSTLLTNKVVHGAMGRLSKDDAKQLNDMLLNQTKVTVIREATAQEIVEENKTFWQRVKDTFSKD